MESKPPEPRGLGCKQPASKLLAGGAQPQQICLHRHNLDFTAALPSRIQVEPNNEFRFSTASATCA